MAELCKGGVRLRDQINRKWPKRDKRADGWIGDSAHASRKSDHNPNAAGTVRALDIDENLGKGRKRNGRTARKLANQLRQYGSTKMPGANRVKYVVYENRITSGTYSKTFWKWRKGSWGHEAHIHISFTSKADRDGTAWPLPILARSPVVRARRRKHLKEALKRSR